MSRCGGVGYLNMSSAASWLPVWADVDAMFATARASNRRLPSCDAMLVASTKQRCAFAKSPSDTSRTPSSSKPRALVSVRRARFMTLRFHVRGDTILLPSRFAWERQAVMGVRKPWLLPVANVVVFIVTVTLNALSTSTKQRITISNNSEVGTAPGGEVPQHSSATHVRVTASTRLLEPHSCCSTAPWPPILVCCVFVWRYDVSGVRGAPDSVHTCG